jgi:hypothetical protein
MNHHNTRITGLVSICSALGALYACGGKLFGADMSGSLEDGGVFLLPDGGVLFEPGSGCATFNVKAWLPFEAGLGCAGPPCSPFSASTCAHASPADPRGGQQPNAAPDCMTWSETTGIPYGMDTFCLSMGTPDASENRCVARYAFDAGPLRCNPGADGDAYCSAFFQQFVRGDGTAIAKCLLKFDPQKVTTPCEQGVDCPQGAYVPTCEPFASGCGELGGLPTNCVQRPGHGPRSELLCHEP